VQANNRHFGFEVVTVVTMKSAAFWVVRPYSSESLTFRRNTIVIFRVKEYAKQEIDGKQLLAGSACFFLGLFFNPEDGGDIFFRNITLSPKDIALQPRRL
jgi:hypothetical protein